MQTHTLSLHPPFAVRNAGTPAPTEPPQALRAPPRCPRSRRGKWHAGEFSFASRVPPCPHACADSRCVHRSQGAKRQRARGGRVGGRRAPRWLGHSWGVVHVCMSRLVRARSVLPRRAAGPTYGHRRLRGRKRAVGARPCPRERVCLRRGGRTWCIVSRGALLRGA